MLPLLVLLFIAVPLVELYVIIQVGQEIGVLWTIAILLADSIFGSVLLRSQGRGVWRRFNAALAAGRPPAREVLDGVLVVFGGALLLTPGFVTDVAGLALLLPPSRALIRRGLVRALARRLTIAVAAPPHAGPPGAGGYDVDGTAVDVDARELRR